MKTCSECRYSISYWKIKFYLPTYLLNEAFSPLYPRAFVIVMNSLDPPHNKLPNNALYRWRTSVGKDKPSLSIGTNKYRQYEVQTRKECNHAAHQPRPGAMRHSSNYIRSGFLSKQGSGKLTEACIRPSCQTADLAPTVPKSVHANNLSLEICVLLVVKSLHSSRDCWTCSRLCVRTLWTRV